MNPDVDRQPLRRFGLVIAALMLAVVMALASCGPGVVGTGTGAPVPAAADAALCSAEFAASLSCAATGSATTAGTAPVVWSDDAPEDRSVGAGATAVARVAGNRLELEQPCVQLRFDGTWSVLDDGRHAFAGNWTDRDATAAQPGLVTVTPDTGDASLLVLRLLDADGVLRHGPWSMRVDDADVRLAACAGTSSRRP